MARPRRLRYLAEALGSEAVGADYVAEVGRSVRDLAYLPGERQPPFWLDRPDPADVIVAANGIVDLAPLLSGGAPVLRPHTSELLAVAGVPYPYDPAAACPRWLDFLTWMCDGNQGEVELVRQYTGWVFVARRLKLERVLWLCGPGGNGKSTAMRVLRYVVGDAATSAVGLGAFTGAEFRLWPALHKAANFACDVDVGRRVSVAGLNAFVSGDPVTIDRKFREQVTLEPATVCFFASNMPPLLADASDAWWRRRLLLNCARRPAEADVDPHLIDRLKAEAPGVLNWALSAIPGLLARGRFDIPDSVRANVDSLQRQVNAARQFISEKLEAGGDDGFVSRDQCMALFEGWCRDNGYKEEDLSLVKEEMRRAFGVELTRLRRGGHTCSGRERVRGWAGVRWRSDEELQPSRAVAEFCRTQREQHQKAEQQHQEAVMQRGWVIRDQAEVIAALEGQLTRLKKQYGPPAAAGGRAVSSPGAAAAAAGPADRPAVPAPPPAVGAPEHPQAAAELDALMARLGPDDEPGRPAGVAG